MVAAWNTVLFDKFCRFRHLAVEGTAQHSDAALDRCRYAAGERVLDVGCGFGSTTQRIALRVAPAGEAVGWDCAETFVRLAEADAADKRIGNARFVVGDVQVADLHGPYDHAFSSFGTMFFVNRTGYRGGQLA
jgi:ubiquinone/menaquinone biosynthesis C-methylase UbiE